MIRIGRKIRIPDNELVFKFSRSSGPGGQNVNKLNTRATLYFDLAGSRGLNDNEKQRALNRLKSHIEKNGILKVICQSHRTQTANRRCAIQRLQELLSEALKEPAVRHKTTVPFSAKIKRLEKKRRHSLLKKHRGKISFEEQ